MRTIIKLIILISLMMVLTSCKEKYGLVNVDVYELPLQITVIVWFADCTIVTVTVTSDV